MEHSIFAMELCVPLDPSLHATLRDLVASQPERVGFQQKWQLYRAAADLVLSHLEHMDRGCWDYFDNDARARKDFDMWVKGMTTEEGVRNGPLVEGGDPYRQQTRYMTLTMAFLLVQGTPTDLAMRALCNIPQADLWKRATFVRILQGMGTLNFASVQSDVIYVIPGDASWGLTLDDLAATKFDYLRRVL